MANRRGEELVAHGDHEEDACQSPVGTARETRAGRPWRPRGRRVLVARGDREGDACQSPVVTARVE